MNSTIVLAKIRQDEVDALNALLNLTPIKRDVLTSYSIEPEYDNLILALVELRRRRTATPSLINASIDTTVTNALVLADELVIEKKLNISADKALPQVTALVQQITKTIDNPSVAQREELTKSINNMQNNLMDPFWQRSPLVRNLVVGACAVLAVACFLAVTVASPVLLAVGVSTLVGDLIFGLALPTFMAAGAFMMGAGLMYDFSESKTNANNKITFFGSSAENIFKPAQEVELREIKKKPAMGSLNA